LKIECRFISPAGLDDALKVLLRVPKIGNKSFDFEYMIVSEPDGREIAEGSSVQVYYDYAAGRTRPIPERFRRLLERSAGKKRTSSAPRRMVDKIIPQARRVRG
jgi:acyl-CoA thioester hydrolase